MIERPRYDLTIFKIHFGLITVKAYTKGEHVLRFEAITHNTKALGCGRVLEKFPDIVARLAGILERFATLVDCVDIGCVPDGLHDTCPRPTQIGATRVGGVALDSPHTCRPWHGPFPGPRPPFTVAQLAAKVNTMTGQSGYTARQAAHDLRKLRGRTSPSNPTHPPIPDPP